MNQKTVTIKLKRTDVCDLLLACTVLDCDSPEDTHKWAVLRDKLKSILDDFDKVQYKSA